MADVDEWYPVALGKDVPAGVTRAVILDGAELVLWRGADGAVHAWEDRCPHRGMRLSYGFVRGNSLACLYHGWEYDGDSRCTRIPAHPDLEVPKTIRATRYASIEQDGLVWVSLAHEPAAPPPALGQEVTPLVSMAVKRPASAIRAATGGAGEALMSLGDDMLFGVHPVSAGKSMLHAVLLDTSDDPELRRARAARVRAFRRQLEADVEMAI